jgi:acyl-CoA synthetase (AMP-forming)/AMP-acid ligase II
MPIVNVASRLAAMAESRPNAIAVVEPLGYDRAGRRQYRHVTFAQLHDDSSRIASGLRALGASPGTRLALLVRPGIDFVSLVFALFKAGMVTIMIDPGMGHWNLVRCLEEAEPEGFIAIPAAQAVRTILQRRFPKAIYNITVGRRWFWGGPTLEHLRGRGSLPFELAPTKAGDPAAIIFTTGSTGLPKGVLYSHGNFNAQVDEIRDYFQIQPGDIDLPAFPLFGLFNGAMGVTAVIPDMNPSQPAAVDPRKIVEAIRDWKITQSFGSPAIWNRVGHYCEDNGIHLPTVRRIMSSGAPIPDHVLRRMKACIAPNGEVYTPYGATESLPVASSCATEVLGETIEQTRQGRGVCVGRRFPGIQWKVVRIVDGPIPTLSDAEELPAGQIGEIIVRGAVVTRQYFTRPEANALGKILDGDDIWHRIGDAGYLDARERFWFCGRVAHRVLTADGPMYTIPCEAILNQHPAVFRSALVGVGKPGHQRPVMCVELHADHVPQNEEARRTLLDALRALGQQSELTRSIADYLIHPAFPVDIRHNAKIFREKLAVWAARQFRRGIA